MSNKGLKMSVVVDDSQLTDALSSLEKALKNPAQTYKEISLEMLSDVNDHFNSERGSSGAWKQLSPATLKKRYKKGRKSGGIKILRDDNELFKSINNSTKWSNKNASLRTLLPYAGIHQFGGMAGTNKKIKITKRDYFWQSKKSNSIVIRIIGAAIERAWQV